MQDNRGKTPLSMLCSMSSFFTDTGVGIEAYLGGCSEGKKAAFTTDNRGKCLLTVSLRNVLMNYYFWRIRALEA